MGKTKHIFYFLTILIVLSNKISYQNKLDFKFSTRTPYRHIENKDLNVGNYSGCEQLKIWMLIRHGSRLPKQSLIDFMLTKLPFLRDIIVNNHIKSRGTLNSEELVALKHWTPSITEKDEEKMLVREGENELYRLGQRTYHRFKKIINSDKSKLKTTPTQRAFESAKHFAKGMFNGNFTSVNIERAQDRGDKLLRFYKTCDRWHSHVKQNNVTYYETLSYTRSTEMDEALKKVSIKMGTTTPIAYNLAKLLYSTCGFETAWSVNDTISPWCALFSNDSIEVFEYADDLKYYWLDGYGNNLNKRLPCRVLDDIIKLFKSDNTSTFYFTHSGTLLKTLAFFGLHEPLADLTHDIRDANRSWRTTQIDAFASNLAFVLYKAPSALGSDDLNQGKRSRVLL